MSQKSNHYFAHGAISITIWGECMIWKLFTFHTVTVKHVENINMYWMLKCWLRKPCILAFAVHCYWRSENPSRQSSTVNWSSWGHLLLYYVSGTSLPPSFLQRGCWADKMAPPKCTLMVHGQKNKQRHEDRAREDFSGALTSSWSWHTSRSKKKASSPHLHLHLKIWHAIALMCFYSTIVHANVYKLLKHRCQSNI